MKERKGENEIVEGREIVKRKRIERDQSIGFKGVIRVIRGYKGY